MRESEKRLFGAFERILALLGSVGAAGAIGLSSCHANPKDACEEVPTDAAYLEPDTGTCVQYRVLPCGLPEDADVAACSPSVAACEGICATVTPYEFCQVAWTDCTIDSGVRPGSIIVECSECNGIAGRRPRGLAGARRARPRSLGGHFGEMARLESASVRAFREIESCLRLWGAPAALADRASEAARDERNHARATGRLARQFGGEPLRPRIQSPPEASLFERVLDDAIEGCIVETFGALLAHFQSTHARDVRVRRALRTIALDETRHAAFSWDLFAWGRSKLPPHERELIALRMRDALATLARRGHAKLTPSQRRRLGAPSRGAIEQLAAHLSSFVAAEILRVSSDAIDAEPIPLS